MPPPTAGEEPRQPRGLRMAHSAFFSSAPGLLGAGTCNPSWATPHRRPAQQADSGQHNYSQDCASSEQAGTPPRALPAQTPTDSCGPGRQNTMPTSLPGILLLCLPLGCGSALSRTLKAVRSVVGGRWHRLLAMKWLPCVNVSASKSTFCLPRAVPPAASPAPPPARSRGCSAACC